MGKQTRLEENHNFNLHKNIFDKNDALKRIDGDVDLLKELAKMFIENSEEYMSDIKKDIESGNCAALRRSAHTIKGALSYLSAKPACETALNLENIGKQEEIEKAEEEYKILEKKIEQLIEVFTEFLKEK